MLAKTRSSQLFVSPAFLYNYVSNLHSLPPIPRWMSGIISHKCLGKR